MSEQERLLEEATQWLVLINSGQASAEEQRAFHAWRGSDPRHEHLCARLETRLGVLQVPRSQGLDAERLRRTLATPSSRRRLLGQALLLGGVALGASSLGRWGAPLDGVLADLSTGTGERRSVALADGSQLTLNARSAVDVRFDDGQRRLYLRAGEILLRVAVAAPALVVATPAGEVRPQGRELLLRHGDDGSQAFALGAPLALRTLAGAELALASGRQVRFDRHGFGASLPSQGTETAWVDGFLEVRDRPLGEVIEALRAYRRGVLRVDPGIAGLRVSGLFRLDDSELVLEALVRTLPIRINRLTDFWITLEAV